MEPTLYESLPPDFPEYPSLTFDEFLPYEDTLTVSKIRQGAISYYATSVYEAAEFMRMPIRERGKPYCFLIDLASDQVFNKVFHLPKQVESVDLYSNFWPPNTDTGYLDLHRKTLFGYSRGYTSRHSKKYAGKSEWLYVISGTIEIDVIRPTTSNLAMLAPDCERKFLPENGTKRGFVMKEGSFLIIPGGWITQRTAREDSFTIGGEYFHYLDFAGQLRYFERDVLDTNGMYANDRDLFIRTLYWLTAGNLLSQHKNILNGLDNDDLTALKISLQDWRKKYKTNTIPRNLYAPMSLNIDSITKDLSTFVGHKCSVTKKLLKCKKEPDNVLMDQTSTYNQPN